MLIPPPRTSVSHDVSGQIIDLVRSGKLIAGDRLPGERQLAEQLNVSRASVRAGVMRLVTMGLLESRPGSGTYVREPGSEVVRDALRVLRHERELREEELRMLREEVQKGIDDMEAGRFSDRTLEDIFEEARREASLHPSGGS